MTSVAIVSVIYGHDYDLWAGEWMRAISLLHRQPDDVLLHRGYPEADEKWPQPRLLNEAIESCKADWIWVLNVDDIALPDGLDGIENVKSDVWLAGYARETKPDFIPEPISAWKLLGLRTNPIPSMSPFRRRKWKRSGGYPLIGHEDWGLWRRMARHGATFEQSGRVHCIYRDHELQRHKIDTDRDGMMRELWEDALVS